MIMSARLSEHRLKFHSKSIGQSMQDFDCMHVSQLSSSSDIH
jgi:hypothetical protein